MLLHRALISQEIEYFGYVNRHKANLEVWFMNTIANERYDKISAS